MSSSATTSSSAAAAREAKLAAAKRKHLKYQQQRSSGGVLLGAGRRSSGGSILSTTPHPLHPSVKSSSMVKGISSTAPSSVGGGGGEQGEERVLDTVQQLDHPHSPDRWRVTSSSSPRLDLPSSPGDVSLVHDDEPHSSQLHSFPASPRSHLPPSILTSPPLQTRGSTYLDSDMTHRELQAQIEWLTLQHEESQKQCQVLTAQNKQYQALISKDPSAPFTWSKSLADHSTMSHGDLGSRATSEPPTSWASVPSLGTESSGNLISTSTVSSSKLPSVQELSILQALEFDHTKMAGEILQLRAKLVEIGKHSSSPPTSATTSPTLPSITGEQLTDSVEHFNVQLDNLRARVAELQSINQTLELTLNQANIIHEQDVARIDNLESSLLNAPPHAAEPASNERIEKLEADLAASYEKMRVLQDEFTLAHASAESRVAEMEARVQEIQAERDLIFDEITQLSQDYLVKDGRVQELEKWVDELRETHDSVVKNREDAAQTIHQLESRLATLNESIQTSAANNASASDSASQSRIQDLEVELATLSTSTAAQIHALEELGKEEREKNALISKELETLQYSLAGQSNGREDELQLLGEALNAVIAERDTILADIQNLSNDFILKDQEASDLANKLAALQDLHSQIKADLEASVLSGAERITKLEGELEAATARLATLMEENAALLDRNDQLAVDVEFWNSEVPATKPAEGMDEERVQALQIQNTQLQEQLFSIRQSYANQISELESDQDKKANNVADILGQQIQELQNALKANVQPSDEAGSLIQKLEQQVLELQESLENREATLKQGLFAEEVSRNEIQSLHEELKIVQAELSAAQTQSESAANLSQDVVNNLQFQLSEMESQQTELVSILHARDAEIEQLKDESHALASKCQKLESQHTELLTVLDAKESTIQNYAVQLQANAEDSTLKEECAALKLREENLTRDLSNAFAQVDDLTNQLSESRKEVSSLEADQRNLYQELEQSRSEIQEFAGLVAELQQELVTVPTLRQDLEQLANEHAALLNDQNSLQASLQEECGKSTHLESELSSLSGRYQELDLSWNAISAELQQFRDATQFNLDEHSELTKQVIVLQQALDQSQAQLASAKEAYESNQQDVMFQCDAYRKEVDILEAKTVELEQMLNASSLRVDEILQAKQSAEQALEARVQEVLGNLTTLEESLAHKEQDMMQTRMEADSLRAERDELLGSAANQIDHERLFADLEAAQQSVMEKESLLSEALQTKSEMEWRIQTLTSDCEAMAEELMGLRQAAEQNQMAASQLATLQQSLEQSQTQLASVKEVYEGNEQDIMLQRDAYREEVDILEAKTVELEQMLNASSLRVDEILQAKQSAEQALEARVQEVLGNLTTLEESLAHKEQDMMQTRMEADSLRAERDELLGSAANQIDHERLFADLEAAQQSVMEKESLLSEALQTKSEMEWRIQTLTSDCEAMAEELMGLRQAAEQNQMAASQLATLQQSLEQSQTQLASVKEVYEGNEQDIMLQRDAYREEVDILEAKTVELEQMLNASSLRVDEILQAKQSAEQALEARVQEVLGNLTTLEESLAHKEQDMMQTRMEADSLRAERDELLGSAANQIDHERLFADLEAAQQSVMEKESLLSEALQTKSEMEWRIQTLTSDCEAMAEELMGLRQAAEENQAAVFRSQELQVSIEEQVQSLTQELALAQQDLSLTRHALTEKVVEINNANEYRIDLEGRLSSLSEAYQTLSDELNLSKESLAEKESHAYALQSASSDWELKVSDLDSQYQMLSEELSRVKYDAEEVQSRYAELENEHKEACFARDLLLTEKADMEQLLSKKSEELDQSKSYYTREIEQLSIELDAALSGASQTRTISDTLLSTYGWYLTELPDRIQELYDGRASLLQSADETAQECYSLREKCGQLEGEKSELLRDCQEMATQIQEISASNAQERSKSDELNCRIQELEKGVIELETQLSDVTFERDALEVSLAETKDRLSHKMDLHQSLASQHSESLGHLNAELESMKAGLVAKEEQINAVVMEYEERINQVSRAAIAKEAEHFDQIQSYQSSLHRGEEEVDRLSLELLKEQEMLRAKADLLQSTESKIAELESALNSLYSSSNTELQNEQMHRQELQQALVRVEEEKATLEQSLQLLQSRLDEAIDVTHDYENRLQQATEVQNEVVADNQELSQRVIDDLQRHSVLMDDFNRANSMVADMTLRIARMEIVLEKAQQSLGLELDATESLSLNDMDVADVTQRLVDKLIHAKNYQIDLLRTENTTLAAEIKNLHERALEQTLTIKEHESSMQQLIDDHQSAILNKQTDVHSISLRDTLAQTLPSLMTDVDVQYTAPKEGNRASKEPALDDVPSPLKSTFSMPITDTLNGSGGRKRAGPSYVSSERSAGMVTSSRQKSHVSRSYSLSRKEYNDLKNKAHLALRYVQAFENQSELIGNQSEEIQVLREALESVLAGTASTNPEVNDKLHHLRDVVSKTLAANASLRDLVKKSQVQASKAMEALKRDYTKARHELDDVVDIYERDMAHAKHIEEELQFQIHRAESQDAEISNLQEDLARLGVQYEGSEIEVTRLKQQLAAAETHYAQTIRENEIVFEFDINSLQSKIKQLEEDIYTERAKSVSRYRDLEECKDRESSARVAAVKSEIADLQRDFANLRFRIAEEQASFAKNMQAMKSSLSEAIEGRSKLSVELNDAKAKMKIYESNKAESAAYKVQVDSLIYAMEILQANLAERQLELDEQMRLKDEAMVAKAELEALHERRERSMVHQFTSPPSPTRDEIKELEELLNTARHERDASEDAWRVLEQQLLEEIEQYRAACGVRDDDISRLNSTLTAVRNDLLDAKSSLASANEEVHRYQIACNAREEDIVRLDSTLKTCRDDLLDAKSSLANANDEVEQCRVACNARDEDIVRLDSTLKACRHDLLDAKSNLNDVKGEVEQYRIACNTRDAEIVRLDSTLKACRKDLFDTQTRLEDSERERNALVAALDTKEHDLETTVFERNNMAANLNEKECDLTLAILERDDLASKLDDAVRQRDGLLSSIALKERELEGLQSQLIQDEEMFMLKIKETQDILHGREGDLQIARNTLSEMSFERTFLQDTLEEKERELMDHKKQLEVSMADITGQQQSTLEAIASLNSCQLKLDDVSNQLVITEKQRDGLLASMSLKEEDTVQQIRMAEEELLKKQEVLEVARNEMQDYAIKLAELERQRDGLLSSLTLKEQDANSLSMVLHQTQEELLSYQTTAEALNKVQSQLDNITTKYVFLEAEHSKVQNILSVKEAELCVSNQALVESRNELHEIRTMLGECERVRDRLGDQVSTMSESMVTFEQKNMETMATVLAEKEELVSELAVCRHEVHSARVIAAGVERRNDELSAELISYGTEKLTMASKLQSLENEMAIQEQLKSELFALREHQQNMHTKLVDVQLQRDEFRSALESKSLEIADLTDQIHQKEQDVCARERLLTSGIANDMAGLRDTLDDVSRERDRLQVALEQNNREVSSLFAQLQAMRNSSSDHNELAKTLAMTMNDLDALKDSYADLERQRDGLLSSLGFKDQELESLMLKLKSAEGAFVDREQLSQSLSSALQDLQGIKAAQSEIEQERNALFEQVESKNDEIQQLKESLTHLKQEFESLSANEAGQRYLDGQMFEMQELLERAKSDAQADLQSLTNEYEALRAAHERATRDWENQVAAIRADLVATKTSNAASLENKKEEIRSLEASIKKLLDAQEKASEQIDLLEKSEIESLGSVVRLREALQLAKSELEAAETQIRFERDRARNLAVKCEELKTQVKYPESPVGVLASPDGVSPSTGNLQPAKSSSTEIFLVKRSFAEVLAILKETIYAIMGPVTLEVRDPKSDKLRIDFHQIKRSCRSLVAEVTLLRATSSKIKLFRADLRYQKIYLSLQIQDLLAHEKSALQALESLGISSPDLKPTLTPLRRFKVAVTAVISIFRMQILARLWKGLLNESQLKQAIIHSPFSPDLPSISPSTAFLPASSGSISRQISLNSSSNEMDEESRKWISIPQLAPRKR